MLLDITEKVVVVLGEAILLVDTSFKVTEVPNADEVDIPARDTIEAVVAEMPVVEIVLAVLALVCRLLVVVLKEVVVAASPGNGPPKFPDPPPNCRFNISWENISCQNHEFTEIAESDIQYFIIFAK